jgi:hypothetical protein
MQKSIMAVLIVCSMIIGLGVGYYFGYDIGWERAIDTIQE